MKSHLAVAALTFSLLLTGSPWATPFKASTRLALAQEAALWLQQRLEGQRPWSSQDQPYLDQIQAELGRTSLELPGQAPLDCRLRAENFQAQPEQARQLWLALKALVASSQSHPIPVNLGSESFLVNNQEIAACLKSNYQAEQFVRLVELCQQRGVFAVRVDESNGLIATSGGEENPDMAARQWVTDTVRCRVLENEEQWDKALVTLARFYTGPRERAAFAKAISQPNSYRRGGPEEGVAHIFYPKTLERDSSWFNNKRLESHGIALQAFCRALAQGRLQQRTEVLESVVLLAQYFLAIDYPSAPSAGNWEETPFEGGLTWDTQAIRGGLQALSLLLTSPEHQALRQRLLELDLAQGLTPSKVEQAIEAGQERLRRTYLAESPGHREMDASLVFLSQTDLSLHDSPLEDVSKHLEMLEKVEQALVRPQGMIRYAPFSLKLADGRTTTSPDSYLTLNYNVALDKEGKINLAWKKLLDEFGSKDASDPQVFAARAALSTPQCEAQWFMVSDLAHGYSHQALKLLTNPDAREQGPRQQELLQRALAGSTRNLNRALARITGPGQTKANGEPAPAWGVPEAYQQVSRLEGAPVGLAGVNSPLTWASASLWSACQSHLQLLRALETRP